MDNNKLENLLFLLNFFDKNIKFDNFSFFLINSKKTFEDKKNIKNYSKENVYINYFCENKKYLFSNTIGYINNNINIYNEIKNLKIDKSFEKLSSIYIGGLGFFSDNYKLDKKLLSLDLFKIKSIKNISIEISLEDLNFKKIITLKEKGVTNIILGIRSNFNYSDGNIFIKPYKNKIKEITFLLENNINISFEYVSGFLFLDNIGFKKEILYLESILNNIKQVQKSKIGFEYTNWNISYNTIFVKNLLKEKISLNKIFDIINKNYNNNYKLFNDFNLLLNNTFSSNLNNIKKIKNIYGVGEKVFSFLKGKIFLIDKKKYYLINKNLNISSDDYINDLLNLKLLKSNNKIYNELFYNWNEIGLNETDLDYCKKNFKNLYY